MLKAGITQQQAWEAVGRMIPRLDLRRSPDSESPLQQAQELRIRTCTLLPDADSLCVWSSLLQLLGRMVTSASAAGAKSVHGCSGAYACLRTKCKMPASEITRKAAATHAACLQILTATCMGLQSSVGTAMHLAQTKHMTGDTESLDKSSQRLRVNDQSSFLKDVFSRQKLACTGPCTTS